MRGKPLRELISSLFAGRNAQRLIISAMAFGAADLALP